MSVPPPYYLYEGATWPIPPERRSVVRSVIGPGSEFNAAVGSRDTAVSYASGVSVAGNTATCDPTTGIDIRILAGVKFSQLKIGWTNTHWDHTTFTFTDTEDEADLTTTATHFDWQDISTPSYDYKHTFRAWRVL